MKSCIFDTEVQVINKEKTSAKVIFSVLKVLCPTITVNINFDSLKPMILISVNHALEHHEN
jgi:hypothetical protein